MSAATEKPKILGGDLETTRMPGHFLLARLGKRVLRPGGRELTQKLIDATELNRTDRVVEFGPGLGATARILLAAEPASYIGVERDETAAKLTRKFLEDGSQRCVIASAESTGLPGGGSSVVVGEAMLTMQREQRKREIVAEAWRLLAPGGRYAIHELAFVPDDVDPAVEDEIASALSKAIHVGARPLTTAAWRQMLVAQGFTVVHEAIAPMALLEPRRMIEDEGLRVLRIGANLIRDRDARRRVMSMRRVFRKHRDHMVAIGLVASKPG